MLDDVKMIHQRDASDALGLAAKQWQQLLHNFDVEVPQWDVLNIVVAGMGGSALGPLMATVWPGVRFPMEVLRDYDMPQYVGDRTLVVASSYSGNTEETLSALAQAEQKGAQIAVITSGGKLAEIAKERGYTLLLLPTVTQPRYATFYAFRALITLLERGGVVAGALEDIEQAAKRIAGQTETWLPEVATGNNPAKQLAYEVIGKSVVVYGGPLLWPAAYKWKISFNENAKQVAWWGRLPEFDHNEFVGWSEQPLDKPYCVIELRSWLEHPSITKRYEVAEQMLSGRRPQPHVVDAEGESIIEHMLYASMFGDFVSIYTALLNGLDPSPVALVEEFKKRIARDED